MTQSTEINDVSPSSLRHLIGQSSVIAQVAVALDAAQMDARKFDHALMVGPPGVGKTALAKVIACETANDLHEILGQSIRHPSDLNALLLEARDRDLIHIDEAHELPKPIQTALYLALDKRRLVLSTSAVLGPQSIPLADFTLLASTTDEFRLLQPLRDRMKLVLRFEFYSVDELTTVLTQRVRALAWSVDENVLPQIAHRSRGTPRLALRLLQACHRVSRSQGEQTITMEHFRRACDLEQIDELGLGPTEQRYLAALASGAGRLNVLASMGGLPSRTISDVVEPFLIRVGFVVKDDNGRRQLTAIGREHLAMRRVECVSSK